SGSTGIAAGQKATSLVWSLRFHPLCCCFALVIHRVGEYLLLSIGDPRTQFLRCCVILWLG
ncbi:hypothetical protein LINPERHAP2_LOCUS39595, partial [Linum perenne]